jgi:methionyl-tRNA formyltransferase
MNILFAGTPEFARQSLAALCETGLEPRTVLTQPDRPAGRGRKLTASPVKAYSVANGLPLMQPASLRDESVVADIGALDPDVMVVAAYGLILPQSVLDIPRRGGVNVHASLLPRWRGAAPIEAAILAGDAQTGVALMQMEAGLDTGPVYASAAISIRDQETAGELHDRLALLGGELLVARLREIVDGSVTATAQDDSAATYAPKIRPADARLDWVESAVSLGRKVRAFNPRPGAWFNIDGERMKCWRASSHNTVRAAPPGTVLEASKDGIDVACGEGVLRLHELQRAGRKRVTAAEFLAQQPLADAHFD